MYAMNLFSRFLVLAAAIVMISCHATAERSTNNGASANAGSTKPNVLLIVVDDLGIKDLGVYGSTAYSTPNLDRLASRSVQFLNAYAANPVCSPTRAAIVTGKSPTRVNITDWISGWGDKGRLLQTPEIADGLALQEQTLAEVFRDQGYKTFFAGKWHLGGEDFLPELQGFDINKGGHHKGSPPGGYYSPYKNPHLTDGPDGEYLPDRLTNETIQFMSQQHAKPFFAMLSFYTVHTPIQASKRHLEQFQHIAPTKNKPSIRVAEGDSVSNHSQDNPEYASMVAAMDENIGRLLLSLKNTGQLDNTLIVFTSDNGGLSTVKKTSRNIPTSNFPYRAGKAFLYEGGIRVPLIIKYPQQAEGVVSEYPAISMDVFATLSGLIDQPISAEQQYDGKDLRQIDHADSSRALYWHYPHYHRVGWAPGGAVREGRWKLIENFETGSYELYDLEKDPSEQQDVAKQFPEQVTRLAAQLVEWRKQVDAKMPVKRAASQ